MLSVFINLNGKPITVSVALKTIALAFAVILVARLCGLIGPKK